jgi:hypothetical protein
LRGDRLEDSLAHQRAWQLASCNAISQTSQKELFLCRDSPKNVAKQEKIATLSPKKHKKGCMA